MLRHLALACSLAVPALAGAQGAAPSATPPAPSAAEERAAVMAVVNGLFDAMRRGDSAAVRASFHQEVHLGTTAVRAGAPVVMKDSLAPFVRAVGTPHEQVWDERLHDVEVRIDGGLASVWAPYEFFLGTRLSHCGVNSFTLGKTAEGWRIVTLVDSRRRTGCPSSAG